MNDADDQTLNSLKDLNAKIKKFNALLQDLIESRNEDKLNYFKDLNAKIGKFNALLVDLSESRKKDALVNGSNQATQ